MYHQQFKSTPPIDQSRAVFYLADKLIKFQNANISAGQLPWELVKYQIFLCGSQKVDTWVVSKILALFLTKHQFLRYNMFISRLTRHFYLSPWIFESKIPIPMQLGAFHYRVREFDDLKRESVVHVQTAFLLIVPKSCILCQSRLKVSLNFKL